MKQLKHGICGSDLKEINKTGRSVKQVDKPEIIKCKDCYYYEVWASNKTHCRLNHRTINANWFCADGKPKAMSKEDDTQGFRFNLWLTNEMQEKGIDTFELSAETGLTIQQIRNYLNEKSMPTMKTMEMILKVFGKRIQFVDI